MAKTVIKSIHGETVKDLLKIVKKQNPKADLELIELAYEYAAAAHDGQMRKAGVPYIVHPLGTAITLARIGMDEETISAGLLHDVPEDTKCTQEDIRKEFGKDIAFLVEGITKVGQLKYRGIDRYVENLRRMFVAMAQDVRVILIKFADRIDNLETLDALPSEKRRRIALESLEIYAPIANRLGIGEIKGKLEDLSFPYIYPEEYKWLTKKVIPQFEEKQIFVNGFAKCIQHELQKHNVHIISIDGRAKHLYSLYQKLIKHNRDISKIYDLVALRIIVDSIGKCYETLGVIHELCKPLKGRIKDYIAQPKPNGYQSLHTTVFSPSQFAKDEVHAEIVEIQIRTPEMHVRAEYGIAAHWKYAEQKRTRKNVHEKFDWMKQMVDMPEDVGDTGQLIEMLKFDFLQNYIFVFTPRGDVIELPEDATPVDFAYKIHTALGNKCSGARVNDQIGSLDTRLKSGDVIEIFMDPHRQGPSSDWLAFVKTPSARHAIRSYINGKNKKLFEKK